MFLSFSLSSVSLCYSFHSAWLVYIMLVALLGLLLSNVIKSSPLTVLQTNRVERRQRHRPFLPPPAPLLPVGDPNSTDRPTNRPTNKPSVPSGPVPSQSWMDGWLAWGTLLLFLYSMPGHKHSLHRRQGSCCWDGWKECFKAHTHFSDIIPNWIFFFCSCCCCCWCVILLLLFHHIMLCNYENCLRHCVAVTSRRGMRNRPASLQPASSHKKPFQSPSSTDCRRWVTTCRGDADGCCRHLL